MVIGCFCEISKNSLCIATAVLFNLEVNEHFGTLRLPFIGQWLWYWSGFMRPVNCSFEPWSVARDDVTGLKG